MLVKKKKFSSNNTIIFTLIILTSIFVILEFASYFFITKYSETGTFQSRIIQNIYHPYLGWVHAPKAKLKVSKPIFYFDKEAYIETDSEGHSITPLSYDNPELTIFITGGSATFGVGATSNSMTVPSQLERKIFERFGVKAQVVNLGARGYTSFQELLSLHAYLVENKADIVIALSGYNDAQLAGENDELKYSLLQKEVFDRVVPLVRDAEAQKTIILHPEGFIRKHSYFFDLLFRVLYRIVGQPAPYGGVQEVSNGIKFDSKNIPARAEVSIRHYLLMKTIAEASGSKFILALQPNAFSWSEYPGRVKYILDNQDAWKLRRTYINAYYNSLAEDGHGLNMLDMRDVMDNEKESPYVDSVHYTDTGTARLADVLIGILETDILEAKLGKGTLK